MPFVLICIFSALTLTFTYLIKSKQCKLCKKFNVITTNDIEMEKKRLNGIQFDIEFRKYKMSR